MDIRINKLRQIGFSNREAEVYVALLQKSEFTAPELTKITNVTRSKIYELLQNLIHKGACSESYRNGQKIYKAIKPKLAIQNIISKHENEIEREILQMKEIGMSIENELATLQENGADINASLDYIEVLTDKGQIHEKWFTIQRSTKKELLVFTKPPYTGIIGSNIKIETESIKNNVITKGIYEYDELASEETRNLIKAIEIYQKIGEDARIVKELPMKLAISDETITMLILVDKISVEPKFTALVINHPSFAKSQKELFNRYWAKGISIKDFKKKTNKYLNKRA